MGKGREVSVDDVKAGARRLWEEFDSGALREAERRRDDAPVGSWECRWWTSVANELRRQFFG